MVKRIVKFGAKLCVPCATFSKTFHKVEEMEEFKEIKFEEVDIEEDEGIEAYIEKYGIKSIPTTLIFGRNDELIFKLSGSVSLEDFIEIINDAIEK